MVSRAATVEHGCTVHSFVQWKFTLLVGSPYKCTIWPIDGKQMVQAKNVPNNLVVLTAVDLTSSLRCSRVVEFVRRGDDIAQSETPTKLSRRHVSTQRRAAGRPLIAVTEVAF